RSSGRAAPMDERRLARPYAALLELVLRDQPVPHRGFELVAQRGLEHLGPVRVDAESDLVLAERREEPAKLLDILHDTRVEVRGRADLEEDPSLRDPLAEGGVLCGMDAVADAVRLQMAHDLVDGVPVVVLSRVDGDAEPGALGLREDPAVVAVAEVGVVAARNVDADDA